MTPYERWVKGKSGEEIVRGAGDFLQGVLEGPEGKYVLIAAQIRSTKELVDALDRASADSGQLGTKVMILTGALVGVGVLQAIVMAWPFLTWFAHHHGIHLFSSLEQ
jgi:hypothetical protein